MDEKYRYIQLGKYGLDDVIFVLSLLYGCNEDLEKSLTNFTCKDFDDEVEFAEVKHTIFDWPYLLDEWFASLYDLRDNLENMYTMTESRDWVSEWVMPLVIEYGGNVTAENILQAYRDGYTNFQKLNS